MQETADRYEMAAGILPPEMRAAALKVSHSLRERAEELRLRAGRPIGLVLPEGEFSLPGTTVLQPQLEQIVNMAAEYSRYAYAQTLSQGYLTLRGGFRLGICGTGVEFDGKNHDLKDISSVCVRILREKRGIAEPVVSLLMRDGKFESTLILSAPGGGKTTFLRDLVRILSDGRDSFSASRVALVDERGEIAACVHGEPQLHVGAHTDVLSGCGKETGIAMLLRTMNPQIIAVDEITQEQDIRNMIRCANCGVSLIATIHAASLEELRKKPLYPLMKKSAVFRKTVTITGGGEKSRSYSAGNWDA